MSLWPLESVAHELSGALLRWRVYELTKVSRFAQCHEPDARVVLRQRELDRAWTMTSEVHDFEPHSGRVMTRTGSAFGLCGEPGIHPEPDVVWQEWFEDGVISGVLDVTASYGPTAP